MKLGVIDPGGGMRGIYAAGIFDFCMDHAIHFDYCIGVSAGSANLASYMAGQRGRNYCFYHDYAFRPEYMGPKQLLKSGSYIGFSYAYGTLSYNDGENPLDYIALRNNPAEFWTVATDAITGKPRYFGKDAISQNDYTVFMASSCVPGVDRPIYIGTQPYFDGALSDPIPLERALEAGCDRLVLILSKPLTTVRSPKKDRAVAGLIKKKYPLAAAGLMDRARRYNAAVERAKALRDEGRLMILAPDDISGVDTLKRDKAALERLYARGLRDGEKLTDFI